LGSTPIGISGSRAAAILGMSKYKTPFAVWQELCEARRPGFNAERGYILEKFEGNASTRFGLAFESSVIELTEAATGKQITDREGEYYLDGEVPITCHIDGRFSDSHIFEGKTVYERGFRLDWGEPGTDRIPQAYAIQVQNNMMVTGTEHCTVGALVFPKSPQEWEDEGWSAERGSEWHDKNIDYLTNNITGDGSTTKQWAQSLAQMGYFHQYPIQSKPDTQKLLKEMYLDFWNRYVLTETPPEITDYEDIRRCFPSPKGTLVINDELASKFREYADIGKELGTGGYLKKKQGELKTEILKICLEKTTVADDESQEKVVFVDESGNKCGQFDGKTFRASK